MIRVEFANQGVASLLVLVNHGVVEGILVLLEPSGNVVRDGTGVMGNGKMTLLETWLWWFGFQEAVGLAQMVALQLFDERLVSG